MKILIIALSGIGDALMFTPALRLLREKYPEAQIDLLAMFKGVQDIYSRNADIHTVYYQDFLHVNPLASLSTVLSLRTQRYDISVNVYPANRWPYNLISYLVGAKKRFGHDYHHANFRSLNFLNNFRILENNDKHNVEENVDLVGLLGAKSAGEVYPLRIDLTEADGQEASTWMKTRGISKGAFIVGFHAGSSMMKNHSRRRWAPEKYAKLGSMLIEHNRATVLLFGGPEEYALNESINKLMLGKAIIVQAPTLMGSIALMKYCSVFVSNDSGLMHIAAGLQLPTVTIFAYTNPNFVYPWKTRYTMVRHDLECSPCFYYSPKPATCIWKDDRFRCITHIEVDEVFTAVKKMIQETQQVNS